MGVGPDVQFIQNAANPQSDKFDYGKNCVLKLLLIGVNLFLDRWEHALSFKTPDVGFDFECKKIEIIGFMLGVKIIPGCMYIFK